MKITILNGTPDNYGPELDLYVDELARRLGGECECVVIPLREKNVRTCTGCFGCWFKKPGECVIPDDSVHIRRHYISSDLVILASPVIRGFPSATLKTVQDKLIPLLHPDFELVSGEVHHKARYESYPRLMVLLHRDGDCDDEDIRIIGDIYRRTSTTLKSEPADLFLTEQPVEEVVHAISAY